MPPEPSAYRYFLGLSSQLPFCATPVRLDSVKDCSFSCGYCFARARDGFGRERSLQVADENHFRQRFERIDRGIVQSALDEFLERKVPLQFGGMSDPFAPSPTTLAATSRLMTILRERAYPYIVSTKGAAIGDAPFLGLLAESRVYVRFSVTVVRSALRALVDRGCPPLARVAEAARKVAELGVPVSWRLQPILPGHEAVAHDLVSLAASVGVRHISAEYLKVSLSANKRFSGAISVALGGEPIATYRRLGARRSGRGYVLPLSVRLPVLRELRDHVHALGMTFGFADNDLLLHSDGKSCCSAADLYLPEAEPFRANVVNAARSLRVGDEFHLSEVLEHWSPRHRVSPYLNSQARIESDRELPDWPEHLARTWRGEGSAYSPAFFLGLERTPQIDRAGNPVFVRVRSALDPA